VVGVRFNLVGGAPLPDFQGAWRDTLTRVAALGWQVEIHREAGDLPLVLEPLLKLGLKVVVDHFGRVDPALGVDDPGFRYLLSTGASRQVWVKLSAQYRNGGSEGGAHFAGQAWPLLRQHLGTDRLLWGSDWPHTQHESMTSYADSWRRLKPWSATRQIAVASLARRRRSCSSSPEPATGWRAAALGHGIRTRFA
jgi:predicted TIM-barrel fold metal-dependent hydrolase